MTVLLAASISPPSSPSPRWRREGGETDTARDGSETRGGGDRHGQRWGGETETARDGGDRNGQREGDTNTDSDTVKEADRPT